MSEPIVENIAAALFTRLESVTEANGYQQTLSAVRPKSTLGDIAPTHLRAVLLQDDPSPASESDVPGAPFAQAWWQPFVICIYVRPSDGDSIPIDTRINRVWADVVKAITAPTAWHTFGAGAINARIDPPERFDHDDGAHEGVMIVVSVLYRTSETDPYTAR